MTNPTFEQPKIYSASQKTKIIYTVLTIPMIVGMGALMLTPFFLKRTNEAWTVIFFLLLGGGFVLLFIYCLLGIWKSKIQVYQDRVIDVGPFRSNELLIQNIVGYKMLPSKYVQTMMLVPRDPGAKKIQISLLLENQTEFLDWINRNFKNLDLEEAKEELNSILQDSKLGATQEERSSKLDSARKATKVLNILGIGAAIWAMLFPRPYLYAISAAIMAPIVCLIIVNHFKGLIKLEGKRQSSSPDASSVFILPTIALSLRALNDWHVLAWNNFWVPFAGVSIFVIFMALILAPGIREKIGTVILIGIFSCVYAYGSIITLNGYLDVSKPDHFTTQITAKRISSGKHTSYYFTLLPWGPVDRSEEVDVGSYIYNMHAVGDSVDIYLKKGRFAIPWFFVR